MTIATLSGTVLDCPDPKVLAEFYSALTGIPVTCTDEDWYQLAAEPGAPVLAFQRAPDHVPPQWPAGDRSQQFHLDFDVPDLDNGEAQVLAIGGRRHAHQPGTTFRVFLDPAGHPFCLCLVEP